MLSLFQHRNNEGREKKRILNAKQYWIVDTMKYNEVFIYFFSFLYIQKYYSVC